jgi:hypothetical protein
MKNKGPGKLPGPLFLSMMFRKQAFGPDGSTAFFSKTKTFMRTRKLLNQT